MEKRRDWMRGAVTGGGRMRGSADGAAGRREALAVDTKEREREPERQAIAIQSERRGTLF